jgi:transposase
MSPKRRSPAEPAQLGTVGRQSGSCPETGFESPKTTSGPSGSSCFDLRIVCFRSIKQAISYCGLCGAEKSSAEKVLRTPISKQRNKHIQRMLVEAARLAPRYSQELALLYERERQRGNTNRATLAVARKMVAHMLAVDRRKTDFIPEGKLRPTAA